MCILLTNEKKEAIQNEERYSKQNFLRFRVAIEATKLNSRTFLGEK